MKTRKVIRQYCQWHETLETLAECSTKPTIEHKTQHTPTPWNVTKPSNQGDYGISARRVDKPNFKFQIAEVHVSHTAKEDAAFIVRAVNSHKELKGLVAEMYDVLAMQAAKMDLSPEMKEEIASRALKAIAKAEGR